MCGVAADAQLPIFFNHHNATRPRGQRRLYHPQGQEVRHFLVGAFGLLRRYPPCTFTMRCCPGLYLDWKFGYGAPTDVSLMLHEQVFEFIKYVSQSLAGASAPQVVNFLQLRVWSRNWIHQLRISALANLALR